MAPVMGDLSSSKYHTEAVTFKLNSGQQAE
jgi:hypothetical protein